MTFSTVIEGACTVLPGDAAAGRTGGTPARPEKPSSSIRRMACGKAQFSMRMTRSTTLPWLPSPKSYQRFSFMKTLKLGELSRRKGELYMSYPPYRLDGL